MKAFDANANEAALAQVLKRCEIGEGKYLRLPGYMDEMPSFAQDGVEVVPGKRCLMVVPEAAARQIDVVVFRSDTDPNDLGNLLAPRAFGAEADAAYLALQDAAAASQWLADRQDRVSCSEDHPSEVGFGDESFLLQTTGHLKGLAVGRLLHLFGLGILKSLAPGQSSAGISASAPQ